MIIALPFPGFRPPEPSLADEAILLRQIRDADAPVIADACADPEIARWIPIPVPYGLTDARTFVAFAADGWASRREATFAITEGSSGLLAGTIWFQLQMSTLWRSWPESALMLLSIVAECGLIGWWGRAFKQ